jgi:hypothetical protein
LDGLTDDQMKALLAKLDKHHPDLRTASPQWRLRRLRTLADGSAEPEEKPKPQPRLTRGKKPAAERPAAPERLAYKSAGAKRKR